MVLLIGIQASGKSSFYKERFFCTHVRVNGDMLKTRRREELLIKACLEGKTKFVVDKMNLTREQRLSYISVARSYGFAVHAYFFRTQVADAVRRNDLRLEAERVPVPAIVKASRTLEPPSVLEHFDELRLVRLLDRGGFAVERYEEPQCEE